MADLESMAADPDAPAAPSESLLTEVLLRIYVAGAVLFFGVGAFVHGRTDPSRITLLLIAVALVQH